MRRRFPTLTPHATPVMNTPNTGRVHALRDVPVRRELPRMDVKVTGPAVPLLDGETSYVRENWVARQRVFDLSKPEDVTESESVWQRIADKSAKYCEHRLFADNASTPRLYMRWVELERWV